MLGYTSDLAYLIGAVTPADGYQGIFSVDISDTTSPDDGETVIVDLMTGYRWVRVPQTYGEVIPTGAIGGRTLAAWMSDVFNVKADWGGGEAVGNGVSDDVAPINAAINAANAAGGGIVYIPRGNYGIGASSVGVGIVMKPNVWLMGGGRDATTLTLLPNAGAHLIWLTPNVDRMMISDMTLDGNRSQQTVAGTHCIRMHGNRHLLFSRIRAHHAMGYGIGAGFTAVVETPIADSRFEDIELHDCGQDGFDLKHGLRNSLFNIYSHDNDQRGIDVRGRQHSYVSLWAYNNGGNGISLRTLGTTPDTDNLISAANCYAFGNLENGFNILNNEGASVDHEARFVLSNCHAWDNVGDGFYQSGTKAHAEYVNCTSRRNGDVGYQVDDGDTTTTAAFSSCIASDNDGTGFVGLFGVGAITYSGCRAFNNGGNDQVILDTPGASWIGGSIDATGNVGAVRVTTNAPGATLSSAQIISPDSACVRLEGDRARIVNNDLSGPALTIIAGADNNLIAGNDFTNVTGAKVSDAGSGNVMRNNIGLTTQAKGTATVLNGTTSIAVAHGLAFTPAAGDIVLTPLESLGAAAMFWVNTYTATQFTINVNADPGTDVDFAWQAVVKGA